MAASAPNRTRSRALRIAAAIGAVLAVAASLKLGGAFDDEEEPVDPAPLSSPPAPAPKPPPPPAVRTIDVGGHPSAIAAGEGGVFVADAFRNSGVAIDRALAARTVPLPHPATAASESGADVWLGFPEQRAVGRLAAEDPRAEAEVLEIDGTPAAIEADPDGAWVLTERSADRVEGPEGEVVEEIGAGGFATAFDVDDDSIWIVADNREVRRFDAASLEPADRVAEVPDAAAIAVGAGYAWVLSATGSLTRLELDSMRRVGEPLRVPGALALAAGEDAVWVTAADGTAVRVDPNSAQVAGDPVRVGAEPGAITTAGDVVWVAGAGDGTVTRITP